MPPHGMRASCLAVLVVSASIPDSPWRKEREGERERERERARESERAAFDADE